jgi:hypothetical protein
MNDIINILAALTAVYGAFLSTYILLRDRPKLKVECSHYIATNEKYIFPISTIRFINNSTISIYIHTYDFETSSARLQVEEVDPNILNERTPMHLDENSNKMFSIKHNEQVLDPKQSVVLPGTCAYASFNTYELAQHYIEDSRLKVYAFCIDPNLID